MSGFSFSPALFFILFFFFGGCDRRVCGKMPHAIVTQSYGVFFFFPTHRFPLAVITKLHTMHLLFTEKGSVVCFVEIC